MPVTTWPVNPQTGDQFNVGTIQYEYQSGGYWKGIEEQSTQDNSSIFCFLLNTIPTDSDEILYQFDIPSGKKVDLANTFAFGLFSTPPASNQVYDIYENEVPNGNTITVETSGNMDLNLPSNPYVGPLELKVRASSSTIIDGTFPGFSISTPVVNV